MKILLTGGATREPIDQVRFITNFSTGRTAAELADFFAECGDQVALLAGEGAEVAKNREVRVERYGSFSNLDSRLRELLSAGGFDAVIHLAAVSDYSVSAIEVGTRTLLPEGIAKIDSGEDEIRLRLKRNFKIVEKLKGYSGTRTRVVGFKLTNTPSHDERQRAIARITALSTVDFVVHNDFSELNHGDERSFTIYRGSSPLHTYRGVPALAIGLREVLR